MTSINEVSDALKVALDTALSSWVSVSYDYETMPEKMNRSYILFWIKGRPGLRQTMAQENRYSDFVIVLTAKYENTAVSMKAAEVAINDMTDAVWGYLDTLKNRPLWTNITFPEEARRGGPHPDIISTYWRIVPIRVLVR